MSEATWSERLTRRPSLWVVALSIGAGCAAARPATPTEPRPTSKARLALARGDALWVRRGEGPAVVREAIAAFSDAAEGDVRRVALARASRAWHFLGAFAGLSPKAEQLAAHAEGTRVARAAVEGNGAAPAEAWAWLAANLADRPGAAWDSRAEWIAVAERLVATDERAGCAAGHRLLGRHFAARPALAGGDVERSRRHFERALDLCPHPLTRLEMATTWAVKVQDVARFRSLLNDLGSGGEFGPEAAALQARARRLLRRERELFGDPVVGFLFFGPRGDEPIAARTSRRGT